MAHEGHFPGRKRIIFRPRFENEYGETFRSASAMHSSTAFLLQREKQGKKKEIDDKGSGNLEHGSTNSDGDNESPSKVPQESIEPPVIERSFSGGDLGLQSDLNTVRALAVACAQYIKEVASKESLTPTLTPTSTVPVLATTDPPITGGEAAGVGSGSGSGKLSALDHSALEVNLTQVPVPVPGTGWGLVDADDSEEGFGVVGIAQPQTDLHIINPNILPTVTAPKADSSSSSSNTCTAESSAGVQSLPLPLSMSVDGMMGDVRQLEESFRQGKAFVETGPCHSGTRFFFYHFLRIYSVMLCSVAL